MIQFPVFPPHMKQAADRQKGQNWFIELLIFFLVYMISSMAASVIVVVGSVAAVLSDSTILKQFASGDVRQAETLMNSLLDSDPIMIVTLFANAAMILITVSFSRNVPLCPWDSCVKKHSLSILRAQGSVFCSFAELSSSMF